MFKTIIFMTCFTGGFKNIFSCVQGVLDPRLFVPQTCIPTNNATDKFPLLTKYLACSATGDKILPY